MTHLKVEQNNTVIEQIDGEVIEKLYQLAFSGDLDGSSNLVGRLHTTATYQEYINLLTQKFPDLYINADKYYIMFADPTVEQILLSRNVGDGTGIIQQDLSNIRTFSGDWFYGSNITSFPELQYFNPSSIGSQQNQFQDCKMLTSVTLPIGATKLNKTFLGCSSLQEVLNTDDLTLVEIAAFSECTSLESVDLPNVQTIGGYVFENCSALTSIGNGAPTTIQQNAFQNCSSLPSIDLSNCTYIGSTAFYGCSSLTFNNLDVSGKYVGNQAFMGCSKITGTLTIGSDTTFDFSDSRYGEVFKGTGISQVILPSNLNTIGSYMFQNCSQLSNIDLSNISIIGYSAFASCTSLTHVDLSNITDIRDGAFGGCTQLGTGETVEITHTSTEMPYNVFRNTKYVGLILHMPNITSWDVRYPIWEGANELRYLDVSDSTITTVGSQYGNWRLETYILPSSLTQFEYRIVERIKNLQYFIILAETPPTGDPSDDFFMGNSGGNANIYVKNSTVRDAYLADSVWGGISNASSRIKTLSELPVGIWHSGLYKQYEPYLSNSSNPVYNT